MVITDDMTMNAIIKHYSLEKAAVQSVKVRFDIVLIAHDYLNVVNAHKAIKKAVENGEKEERRINASVKRILQLK